MERVMEEESRGGQMGGETIEKNLPVTRVVFSSESDVPEVGE
jgi:hypothetical protein